MRARELLLAAADLLDKPGTWTQGWTARTKNGRATYARSPRATCWCSYGALVVSDQGDFDSLYAAERQLADFLGCHIAKWNDEPERTQAEVVAALRAAAEVAS